jgi:hypothetical protein
MQCPLEHEDSDRVLLDYAAGRLRRAAAMDLETHIRACARCAKFDSEQQRVWRALNLWEMAPVDSSFNQRLFERLDLAPSLPWYRRALPSRPMWWHLVSLTAVCVLAVAAFVEDNPLRFGPAAPAGLRIGPSEADQVEVALTDLQLLRQLDFPPVMTAQENYYPGTEPSSGRR